MHDTMTVFAIYDVKSEGWSRPVYSRNEATCTREVRDVLSQGNTPYSLHPEDYSLFRLGTWSENEPFISYDPAPTLVLPLLQLAPKGREFGDHQLSAA